MLTAVLDSRGDNSHGQLGTSRTSFQAKPRLLSSALFPQRADGNELSGTEGAFEVSVWDTSCKCVVQVRSPLSRLFCGHAFGAGQQRQITDFGRLLTHTEKRLRPVRCKYILGNDRGGAKCTNGTGGSQYIPR
jgi:hypothetical protein